MEKKYIAVCRGYCGTGKSLKDAFDDLTSDTPDIDFKEVTFFEAEEIKVQFEIVKLNN